MSIRFQEPRDIQTPSLLEECENLQGEINTLADIDLLFALAILRATKPQTLQDFAEHLGREESDMDEIVGKLNAAGLLSEQPESSGRPVLRTSPAGDHLLGLLTVAHERAEAKRKHKRSLYVYVLILCTVLAGLGIATSVVLFGDIPDYFILLPTLLLALGFSGLTYVTVRALLPSRPVASEFGSAVDMPTLDVSRSSLAIRPVSLVLLALLAFLSIPSITSLYDAWVERYNGWIARGHFVYYVGFVLDARTGTPVEDADVQLQTEDIVENVSTDLDGQFRLQLKTRNTPATAVLTVEAGGYDPYSEVVDLRKDHGPHVVQLRRKVAMLQGVVLDAATGQPIAAAIIRVSDRLETDLSDQRGHFIAFMYRQLFPIELYVTKRGFQPADVQVYSESQLVVVSLKRAR